MAWPPSHRSEHTVRALSLGSWNGSKPLKDKLVTRTLATAVFVHLTNGVLSKGSFGSEIEWTSFHTEVLWLWGVGPA